MTQQLEFLPLNQTMPLLNPHYPPDYYENFTQLKKHIELKLFNARANQLAEWMIPYGQSNYNCWYVKKMCFLAGAVTLDHEMQFSEQTLYEKVKNFQLWEHRQFLLQHSKNYDPEYDLVNKILKIEPKNYHAWSHRIWLVNQVQNYAEEIQFTQKMLKEDPYNNSVWSYRHHLLGKIMLSRQNIVQKQKIGHVEICETIDFIQKHLNNQAAWNYLRGYFPSIKLKKIPCSNPYTPLLVKCYTVYPHILQFVRFEIQKLQKMFQSPDYKPQNYFLQAQIQLLITLVCIQSQSQSTVEYARNTCLVLAQKDKQKRFYWKWVALNM